MLYNFIGAWLLLTLRRSDRNIYTGTDRGCLHCCISLRKLLPSSAQASTHALSRILPVHLHPTSTARQSWWLTSQSSQIGRRLPYAFGALFHVSVVQPSTLHRRTLRLSYISTSAHVCLLINDIHCLSFTLRVQTSAGACVCARSTYLSRHAYPYSLKWEMGRKLCRRFSNSDGFPSLWQS